ncbi:hypothetical protein MESS4_680057 [Mesorhizobium sp. STM 4661]|nr:hypothetical protein MESS4_680057 [Mesorhizobium sp. STM 4661]
MTGEKPFSEPRQHHRAKLPDGLQPALAAGTPKQQLLFGFRRFENDADRPKPIGDGVDDGPDMQAALGDDDDRRQV